MSIDLNPTCPIIARFAEDLKLNGKRTRTQQSYCRHAREFAEYLGHSPDLATEDQFRNYLLYLVDCKKWKSSTVNVAMQALKLFFRITCPRDWKSLKLARVKVEQRLPVVITIGEVHTLLKLIEKPSMRCFFTVVYAMGLRMQEALHLQVRDIDSKRMLIHVHRGKGAKDRLVPLPQSTLIELRKYYASVQSNKFKHLGDSKYCRVRDLSASGNRVRAQDTPTCARWRKVVVVKLTTLSNGFPAYFVT